jgi:uracil-DNA glycosylase family 4
MNKHPLADCDNCSLQRAPYVPSKAPQGQASYAIVAESPGYTEALAKETLIGASGKLIKEVLHRHGIDPKSCFLTNVVSCYPGKDEKPPTDAIKACRPRLVHELANSGAERVLATGNFAARALLQTNDGILKTRVGPPRDVQLNGTRISVVPTVHPAAALRSSDFFPYLVTDIGKLKNPVIDWEPPKWKVVDNELAAFRYIKFLSQFQTLSVDIETAVEKDVAFEHPEDTDILCVGIAYSSSKVVVFTGDVLRIPAIGSALGQLLSKATLIAQNGKFDIPVLRSFEPSIRLGFDTMLAHAALDERRGIHGLKVMSRELLGAPDYAAKIKQFTTGKGASFSSIPSSILYEYNAYDCALTFQLHLLFSEQLHAQKLTKLHDFLVRASNALMPVEREGVAVDLAYLEELDESFKTELEALEQPLQEWVENPRSPDQVLAAIHRLGVNCASTRMPLLQELRKTAYEYQSSSPQARDVVRFIDALEAYRKAFKQYSTYVRGLKRRVAKGRVHTSYLLHGTSTGRLSSRNPNLQNQPRGPTIRKLFIPGSPENVFVKADYAQGEWRVVTILADEPYFAERFAAGRDVVADLQEELFRNRTDKELRTKTKNIAYGSWYGMILGKGDQGVHYARNIIFPDLPPEVAEQQAFAYQSKLFQLAPNIIQWQATTRRRVLDGEVLTNYKGRRRHFWLITNTNKHNVMNECLAFVPQATLTDICLTGLCELSERGYKVRLSTHDEVVTECHWSDAERIEKEIAGIMSNAAKEFSEELPFPVETSIGKSWGDC